VYAGGIVLLMALGQFTAPLLLGTREGVRVLTTEMYYASQAFPVDYGLAAAYGSPLLVIGIVVLLLQRRLMRDRDRFATVTGKSMRYSDRSSKWASIPILLYGFMSLVLPLAALALVGFSQFWTGDVGGPYTDAHFRTIIFEDDRVQDAIMTSLRSSLLALLVVLPLGLAAAVLNLSPRSRRRTKAIVDLLVNIPLGLPAVLFGAAILFTYVNPPIVLYGTVWIIVIAYVTIMIPHASRLQMSAITSLGPELAEAAEVGGAVPLRTLRTVTIPLIRRGMASAAAIILIILMQEFSVSLFVRATDTETMGSLLFYYWEGGIYPQVAILALLMVVVTAFVGCVALAFGRDHRSVRQQKKS
jgi:iron(III) transport system permease protein